MKFAEYLYNTNQFEFAAREFERCVFLKPEDSISSLYLLKVYRKLAEYDKATKLVNSNKMIESDESIGSEYFKLLIQANRFKDAELLISEKDYLKDKPNLKLSTILLQKDWKYGSKFCEENQSKINKSLSDIVKRNSQFKRKSPFLAGLFSTILPGAGKVYSGRWQDGLISFVMTGTSGFVAVRGFSRNSSNALPWVMGTFFVAYYTGNIYGSVQAANKFNKSKEDEWTNQVRDFVLHD